MSTAWQIAFAVQSLGILLLGVLLLGLLRRVTPTLEAVVARSAGYGSAAPLGLQPGSAPSNFTVSDDVGKPANLNDLLAETATLVLFLSNDCAPCAAIATEIVTLDPPPEDTRLIVIELPHMTERPMASVWWLRTYRDNERYEAANSFQTNATPHAFLLDTKGLVRRNFIPMSAHELVDLLGSVSSGNAGGGRMHHHPSPVGPARS